jgi:hypothetical protein
MQVAYQDSAPRKKKLVNRKEEEEDKKANRFIPGSVALA